MDKELRNISNSEYFSRVARCSFFTKEKRHFERTTQQPSKVEPPQLHEHIKEMKEQLLKGFLSDPKKKRAQSITTYIRSIRTQPMLR